MDFTTCDAQLEIGACGTFLALAASPTITKTKTSLQNKMPVDRGQQLHLISEVSHRVTRLFGLTPSKGVEMAKSVVNTSERHGNATASIVTLRGEHYR